MSIVHSGKSDKAVYILEPGQSTTLQDQGRWGYQRFGVPISGPMDRFSHRLANLIVGNDQRCTTLEVTFTGPRIVFEHEQVFGVTGAEFDLTLDGRKIPMNTAVAACSGACLKFGKRQNGVRSYIAFSGGLNVPSVLGSRSTHLAAKLGGLLGRAVKAGDKLAIGREVKVRAKIDVPRNPKENVCSERRSVRIIENPVFNIESGAPSAMTASPFIISTKSDRMGYRLLGRPIEGLKNKKWLSSAVVTGTIQLPKNGEPIILMVDHQTTGGYPVIANVISADIPILAQRSPGGSVKFEAVTYERALVELIRQERVLLGES